MRKEAIQPKDTIPGESFIVYVEEKMGETGLQILAALAKEFLYPEEEETDQENILNKLKPLEFTYEMLGAFKDYHHFEYHNERARIAVGFNLFVKDKTPSSWHVERHIALESGKEDLWQLDVNYSAVQGQKKEVQFDGGQNKFTHGETGVTVCVGSWFKIQSFDEETWQPIVIFSVHKGKKLIQAITLPTNSLTFRVERVEQIPFSQSLPRLAL